MITYQLQDVPDSRDRGVRGRAAGRAPARARAVQGGRPVPVRTRPAGRPGASALCPSPVPLAARSRPVPGPLRRLVTGAGLALASAAAVVGLGLLADVSSAVNTGVPAAVAVPPVAGAPAR